MELTHEEIKMIKASRKEETLSNEYFDGNILIGTGHNGNYLTTNIRIQNYQEEYQDCGYNEIRVLENNHNSTQYKRTISSGDVINFEVSEDAYKELEFNNLFNIDCGNNNDGSICFFKGNFIISRNCAIVEVRLLSKKEYANYKKVYKDYESKLMIIAKEMNNSDDKLRKLRRDSENALELKDLPLSNLKI